MCCAYSILNGGKDFAAEKEAFTDYIPPDEIADLIEQEKEANEINAVRDFFKDQKGSSDAQTSTTMTTIVIDLFGEYEGVPVTAEAGTKTGEAVDTTKPEIATDTTEPGKAKGTKPKGVTPNTGYDSLDTSVNYIQQCKLMHNSSVS